MQNNKIIKFFSRNAVAISACVLVIAFSIGYWVFAAGTTSVGPDLTVGNNLYVTGKVGIGTTSPVSKISFGGVVDNIASRIALFEASGGDYFYGIGMAHPGSNYGLGLYGGTGAAAPPSNTNMHVFIQNTGNVGIGTTAPAYKLDVRGGTVAGAGAYVNSSWSGYKQDFQDVNPQDILEKIGKLDIKSWVYKPNWVADDPYRHISPFGEDFYNAFGLGKDGKVITSLDVAGVGLVGIQGLQKEIEDLKLEVSDLKAKLDAKN